jgi:hypothetical protein
LIRVFIPSLACLLVFAGALFSQSRPEPAVAADRQWLAGVMHLAKLSVRADLDHGVARVRVSQTFRNGQHSRMPGDEAVTSFEVSPLTAFWNYRITEEGKWWNGLLVPRQEGRAEYDRIVRRSRDPGLLEWQEPCRYTSSVYPVPPDGGTKDVEFEYDEALRLTTDGHLVFRFPLGAWLVEEVQFELRVRDGRGLSGYRAAPELPVERAPDGSETCAFVGRLQPKSRLPDLELRLQLARPFAGPGGKALRPLELPGGELLVPIPVSERDLESRAVTGGFLIGKRQGPAPAGVVRLGEFAPVPTGPELEPPVEIDADFSAKLDLPASLGPAWKRLREQAVAQSLYREGFLNRTGSPPSARTTQFGCVTPFASFLAKPAPDPERKLPGPRTAAGADASGSLPPLPSAQRPVAGRASGSEWHFSPFGNFRAARERAYHRACFANQKTIAGALEMYELDSNARVAGPGGLADRAAYRSLFSPARGIAFELLAVHAARPPWRPGRWLDELPAGLWKELVDGGYLRARPECPGASSSSLANYALLQPEGRVFCLRHGLYDATGAARQQLVEAGVGDPSSLARAEVTDFVAARRRREKWRLVEELAQLLAIVLMLGCIVWGVRALGVGGRALGGAAVALIASGCMVLQLPRERGAEDWGLLLVVVGGALVLGWVGQLLLVGLAAIARRCSAWLTPALRSKPEDQGPER